MTTYKVIAMCCSTIACILSITISKVKEKKRKELAYLVLKEDFHIGFEFPK